MEVVAHMDNSHLWEEWIGQVDLEQEDKLFLMERKKVNRNYQSQLRKIISVLNITKIQVVFGVQYKNHQEVESVKLLVPKNLENRY